MKTAPTCSRGLAALAILVLLMGGLGPATAVIIYSEDFEDGVADGFTQNGLWHVTNNFPSDGTYALGYVQNETIGRTPNGNYNVGNVVATTLGPALAIPTGLPTTLSLDVFVGDEYNVDPDDYDQFSLWASLDGSTLYGPSALASSAPSAGGVNIPEWSGPGASTHHNIAVDLSVFAGLSIYLAYRFDPGDGRFNSYPGVRIDNLQVEATPEAPTFLLLGVGLGALGIFRRRLGRRSR